MQKGLSVNWWSGVLKVSQNEVVRPSHYREVTMRSSIHFIRNEMWVRGRGRVKGNVLKKNSLVVTQGLLIYWKAYLGLGIDSSLNLLAVSFELFFQAFGGVLNHPCSMTCKPAPRHHPAWVMVGFFLHIMLRTWFCSDSLVTSGFQRWGGKKKRKANSVS